VAQHSSFHRVDNWHLRRQIEWIGNHDLLEALVVTREQHLPHHDYADQPFPFINHEEVGDECGFHEMPQFPRRISNGRSGLEHGERGLHHVADAGFGITFVADPLIPCFRRSCGDNLLPPFDREALQGVLGLTGVEQHQHLSNEIVWVRRQHLNHFTRSMCHHLGQQSFDFRWGGFLRV
jgi:hypothetical protein